MIVHAELAQYMGGEVRAGLQGVGKTTVSAKRGSYMKKLVLSSAFVFDNLNRASIQDNL